METQDIGALTLIFSLTKCKETVILKGRLD